MSTSFLSKLHYAAKHLLMAKPFVMPAAVKVGTTCSNFLYSENSHLSLLFTANKRLLIQVMAAVVEMQMSDISGFNLSSMNRYLWYPGPMKIKLDR